MAGVFYTGANQRFQNAIFTSNGTFTVPNDVYMLWLTGTGGGGGGGGGNSTPGGGGGGGSSGVLVWMHGLPVSPGDVIGITIGAAGAAGAINGAGGAGGHTIITLNGIQIYSMQKGAGGSAGANPNGGSGANCWYNIATGGTGGAGAGVVGTTAPSRISMRVPGGVVYQGGASGGALNFAGAAASWIGPSAGTDVAATSTGNANGGGGGGGANSIFGTGASGGYGGVGGSNGAAGSAPASSDSYGAGGGGGSGNSAGGAGIQGFAMISYDSAYIATVT